MPGSSPVVLTHPERPLFPRAGIRKGDLAAYYEAVADVMLPLVKERPLSVVRCPEGRRGACFFQRHATPGLPEALRTASIEEKHATRDHMYVRDVEGLRALAQISVLEVHVWGVRVDRIERPDRLVFDLDPGEGVGWPAIVDAARTVRDRLRSIDVESWVMTTGGRGLHVVAPLERRQSWDALHAFARSLAVDMAAREPERFVATAAKAQRRGRVFLDYLRNTRGATAIAPYSTRDRDTATVAVPLRWDELGARLDPSGYTVKSVPRRLASLSGDPWSGYLECRQSIGRALD